MIGTADIRVGPEAIREELRRILNSSDFDASARNRRFLGFVVEATLSGESEQIKAYTIATTVFERGADFDPQLNSIVRIEAGRLRRSLENYYLRAGADDPVRISIPKGSYVPTFRLAGLQAAGAEHSTPDPAPRRKTGEPRGPMIFVPPFQVEGDQSAHLNFADGLRRQIIVGLTRFTDLFVFGPNTTFGIGASSDPARIASGNPADFILTVGTSLSESEFRVEVLLVNSSDGQYLWGETFKRQLSPGDILGLRDEVANRVVQTLAQPYGILFTRARETDGANARNMSSYDCVARFHSYWRTYDREMFEPVRKGLEHAIVADPGYAEAYACLSQMYSNAARFSHDVSGATADPLGRATDLAHRAIELAPNSSRGHHALGLALWFIGNLSGCIEALETGLALNPNDSEIMADLGLRRAMLMDWERGVPLIEESYARNPAQPGPYRIGLALNHFAQGRDAQAFDEACMVDAPHVVYGHLLTAASAARLGRKRDADASLRTIAEIDANYFDHIVEDLERRHLHPDLVAAIVGALRMHGCRGRDMIGKGEALLKRGSGQEPLRTGSQ